MGNFFSFFSSFYKFSISSFTNITDLSSKNNLLEKFKKTSSNWKPILSRWLFNKYVSFFSFPFILYLLLQII